MRPLKKTRPRTADLSRFTGKEIEQRYPRRIKGAACFMLDCRVYYVPAEFTGELIYVVADHTGVCAVTDAAGDDISFSVTPEALAAVREVNS